MKQKLKEYWAKNTTDLVTRGNFISRILQWLIFISLLITITELFVFASVAEHVQQVPVWIDKVLAVLFIVPVLVLIYAAKVFLAVIPIIWLIQCWYCIKGRKFSVYVISNLLLWVFIAASVFFITGIRHQEAECMKWCVNADQSNYESCLNTCN